MTDSLIPYQARAVDILSVVEDVAQIDSDEEAQAIGAVLVDVKTQLKLLKAEEEAITRPQREALDAVRGLFKAVSEKFIRAESTIKRLVSEYDQRRKEDERKALAAALDSPSEEGQRSLVNLASQAAPVLQGISVRDGFDFSVTDESLIPREYLTPDLKKIGGVVRASKGSIAIPGVAIIKKAVVSARGR